MRVSRVYVCAVAAITALIAATPAAGADIYVPDGGDLQAAIDGARPGDTIRLAAGATYVGNFELPVHGGTSYVTIRSAAIDSSLPAAGSRINPAYAPQLPKIQSPNSAPAIATRPGAAYWKLMFLELKSTWRGLYDIVALGDGSGYHQTDISHVAHHLVLDRVYIHGDPLWGQKRGIALNSGTTSVVNSYISEIKALEQDSQAIGGWNGPGPYTIENNYLEAAGEVFLLGGSDPSIPNLVATDVVIRGNTLTRPVRWRDPILSMPGGVHAAASSGGELPAGTYEYRVVARAVTGAYSIASTAVATTVSSGGQVVVSWAAVADAAEYDVYAGTNGDWQYWTTAQTTFVHADAWGTAGSPPDRGSVWQVKNLLELKNARLVRIERNVLENNWAEAQVGIAVLFTPRNQDGSCTWCVVEDVTFESNVLRNVAGGINILGYDDFNPSQQTRNITIRNNVVSGLSQQWGGPAYFLQLLGSPRNVVVDHNTVVSPDGYGIVMIDGGPVAEFTFTNNVMRHNDYGIIGSGAGPGHDTIATFLPGSVIARNVMAGDDASAYYPAGNLFPTVGLFEGHFVDYGGGNYALKPATDWERAGTDGKDLGAQLQLDAVPMPPRAPTGLRVIR